MVETTSFQFTPVTNAMGEVALRPLLPLQLTFEDRTVQTAGLVDTGADVNVLPFDVGIALGAVWDQARTGLRLSGNLANYEARGLLVTGTIGGFAPV